MYHLGLDGTVSVVFTVEVLRFVTHAMASVTDDWDLDLGVVWHFSFLTSLVRSHGDLEAGGHGLELVCGSNVTILQARAHWVDVEEWVLSVLDVGGGLPVQ